MYMWSWLQKLIRYLQGEEEQHPNSERLPVAPGQLQAKTKSIYPRERMDDYSASPPRRAKERQFRFPVIPDEPKDRAKREQLTLPLKEKPVVTLQKAKPVHASEEKRPYKPSEVYSPIYGKIQPGTQMPTEPQRREEKVPLQQMTPVEEIARGEAEAAAWAHTPPVVSRSYTDEPAVEKEPVEHQPVVESAQPNPAIEASPQRNEPDVELAFAEAGNMLEDPAEEIPSMVDRDHGNAEPADTQADETVEEPAVPEPVIEARETPIAHWSEPRQEEAQPAEPQPQLHTYIPTPQPPRAAEESAAHQAEQAVAYELPPLSLLNPSPSLSEDDYEFTLEQKQLLEETLANFHVSAQVVGIVKGPSVTRFELQPAPGVKVNKITGLIDDIKLNMAAKDIRIEAPIPGRNAVGIEVPNLKSEPIFISRIIGSEKFRNHPSPLAVALGMDIGGEPIVADIKKMPHGLIAGATGSGKSVCINSIIVSLLYKATPEQVRLLLIDPKMVELAPYNHLPHLVTPVVTDAKQATAALKWAVEEMEKRYALFVEAGVRDIDRYNLTTDEPLPYIVIVIDELADLMMVSPQDVEDCIIRIAQKARACGIHLLLATQRPSVDVITGNIKANVPTRLAFAVFSQVDSRTILDQSGAERLLGRGDMLFLESGATPTRLQGNYVSDDEIERVTSMIKKQRKPEYYFSKEELEQQVQSYDMGDDPLYHEALLYVAEQGQASASALQRRFRIGYNRAARLIEMMEAEGHVAGQSGGKPRAVLITREDAQALAEGSTLL
jgi:S-DNA-T family DNA segregation ATPase FtsK/SpoIIIE